jgi:hypothetical protein
MNLPERGINIGAICDHRPKLISKKKKLELDLIDFKLIFFTIFFNCL